MAWNCPVKGRIGKGVEGIGMMFYSVGGNNIDYIGNEDYRIEKEGLRERKIREKISRKRKTVGLSCLGDWNDLFSK